MLETIHYRLKNFQYLVPKPYVFRIKVPKFDIIFNSKAIIYILYIEGLPVLHHVDLTKHFKAARFLE